MKKIFIILLALIFLAPVASGNAGVLFEDNFDDGDYSGWTHILGAGGTKEPGAWTVQDGHLQSTSSSTAQNVLVDNLDLPASFILELDTRNIVGGGGAASLIGFYVHWAGWENRVEVGYRPGRIYIKQVVDAVEYDQHFAQDLPVIDPLEWHRFRLEKDDTLCTLYLDGEFILQYELPVEVSGGSLVLAGTPGTRQFDNVMVRTLPELVRHEFSGTITALRLSSDNPLTDQVQVGDSFCGFYEFDASQPPFVGGACQDDLQQCYWEYLIPPNQFAISVGPFNAAVSQRYNIVISNGIPHDSYTVFNPDKVDLNGWLVNFGLALIDETGNAINDPQLPFLDPPNPDDFASNRHQHFQIFASGTGSSDFVNGRLDRFVRVPYTERILFGWKYSGAGLVSIDIETGEHTLVLPSDRQIEALAFDSVNGVLYGVENLSGDTMLLEIDYKSESITEIGSVVGFTEITAMTFDETTGKIYALDQTTRTLLEINPSTGEATAIGNFSLPASNGLAAQPMTGELFASVYIDPGYLARIDKSTAASTLMGPFDEANGAHVRGLAFNPETGVLFGQAGGAFPGPFADGRLVTINLATGQATPIGESQGQVTALAFAAKQIPEPKIIWDLDSIETVLTPGTEPWESNQLWHPFVMYDEGMYKMWYAGTPGTSGEGCSGIGYATSTDGVIWTNKQKVHGPSACNYKRSDSPFVIKEGDTYRMWHRDYYEGLPGCPEGSEWSGYVSHMTSSDGTGWPSQQQILSAQGQSEFQGDGYNIDSISVLKEGSQYTMWYSVHDCPLTGRDYYPPKIWRATSTDGTTWENRELSLPYIEGSWENLVYDPHVVKDGNGVYLMFYTAYSGEEGQQLAMATSTDGKTWLYRQQIGIAGRSPYYFEDIDGTPYLYFSTGDELHEGNMIVRMRGTKVGENQPPEAICQDVTVPTDSGECSAAEASVDNGSYDPDGDPITLAQAPLGPYDLGTTRVTLTVTDDKDAFGTCSATVTVVDQEPPIIQSLVASPDTLWAPNHKMVPVSLQVQASDNCDSELSCQITSVTANEPEATTSDWEITGYLTVELRAERSGTRDGRVYTITVQCTDASGNTTTGTVEVSVPHDQGKGKKKGKK